MAEQPRLLVVDDEEAICEGCRRIFTRQGFHVSKSNQPDEGLRRATAEDYAAILLDIKMPEMSGLDFLSRLRTAHCDTPVILMTGYPSVPTAISAVQLGAAGYVMKPFTPEEITQAVYSFLPKDEAFALAAAAETPDAETAAPLFWHEAWLRRVQDDQYRVGALVPGVDANEISQVRLPSIGQVVYQGLPLAEIVFADGKRRVVPSPLTGVVQAANPQSVADLAAALVADPCGQGWIAEVCATRAEEDLPACTPRRVVVVSSDPERAELHRRRLAALGCEALAWSAPITETAAQELASLLAGQRNGLVMFDAQTLGEEGPRLAGQLGLLAATIRVMVLDAQSCAWEKAYRAHKILYYAADPMAEDELVEVLDSAFRTPVAPRGKSLAADESVASIQITNRKGSRVTLIAAPGILHRNSGLGAEIRGLLYDRLYPIQTIPGLARVAPRDVLNAAQNCDRVVVLLTREGELVPGALTRDTGAELATLSDLQAGKVTTLLIQPQPDQGSTGGFDSRTLAQLARHVVNVMADA